MLAEFLFKLHIDHKNPTIYIYSPFLHSLDINFMHKIMYHTQIYRERILLGYENIIYEFYKIDIFELPCIACSILYMDILNVVYKNKVLRQQ